MFNKSTKLLAAFFLFNFSISLNACRSEVVNDKEYDDSDLQVLHEKTFQISPGKSLKIEGSSGDIKITGWDKSEVYVKITGNEKAKERYEFTFDDDAEEIHVKAEKESSFFSWGGVKLKFEVKVPSEFNPKIATSGGDIKLAGVSGDIVLNTSGGDVTTKYTQGKLRIATSGGDINFQDNKGNIKATTSGGDIIGKNFEGDINIVTSGGDIELNGKNSKIEASTSGGDVELAYTGENKGIELSTSGGDIYVNLPSDFNARAKIYSSAGGVKCDFNGNNVKQISSSRFEADFNKGGNPFVARTSGGSVRVKKF